MGKTATTSPPDAINSSPQKTINAKEFLACFRAKPDDFYLLEKFGIRPNHLKRIYSALIEKGLLSEYEYNRRERKLPKLDDHKRPQLPASMAISIIEEPSEALSEHVLNLGYSLDPDLAKALSDAIKSKELRKSKPLKADEEAPKLCPKCHKPKHPSAPDECIYCGVVFGKIEVQNGKGKVSIWPDE
ncbi:MAG: hypothetical protein ACLP5H_09870 [Desulfomonilaceae bacterium]